MNECLGGASGASDLYKALEGLFEVPTGCRLPQQDTRATVPQVTAPQLSHTAAFKCAAQHPTTTTTQTTATTDDVTQQPASAGRVVVLALSALENAILRRAAPGIVYGEAGAAALDLVITYLTALEGPFWVEIRGRGLAYGSYIHNHPETGLVYFGLSRSVDPGKAFLAAKGIVDGFASGERVLDDTEFENAKSALASEILQKEASKSAALAQRYTHYFAGVPEDSNRRDLESALAVTKAEALDALKRFLVPLFQAEQATTTVAVPTAKLSDVATFFKDQLQDADRRSQVQDVPEAKLSAFFGVEEEEEDNGKKGTKEDGTVIQNRPEWLTPLLVGALAAAAAGVAMVVLRNRRGPPLKFF